jgi:RimJ/RimL family protein N-acetyltransferase
MVVYVAFISSSPIGVRVAESLVTGRRVNVRLLNKMPGESAVIGVATWRNELPSLNGRVVTLREPVTEDLGSLVDLLSIGDATNFGREEPVSDVAVLELIERFARERASGVAFTYAITLASARTIAGLVQVRQLDPSFEAAEWECTIAPSFRGSGVFLDAARLVGSFAFGNIGTHRLEARVLLQHGRANGALRKLGAVQEGVLRRSVRRADDYFDQVLWSLLKEDWGGHWVSIGPRVH